MEINRGCGVSQFSVFIWEFLTFDHHLAIYVCVMSKLRLYVLRVVLLHSFYK